MDLFTLQEFTDYLHLAAIDSAPMTVARRVAYGWLKSATGLADWPATVPDQLFGWGLELAAIAYRNPEAASSESIDDYNVSWDAERQAQILAAARAAYSTASTPSFSFPDPDWHWTAVPVVPSIVQ